MRNAIQWNHLNSITFGTDNWKPLLSLYFDTLWVIKPFYVFFYKAFEVPGVKVLRFESTLYFGNVERFRNMLVDITGKDPSIQQEPRKEVKVDAEGGDSSGNAKLIDNEVNEGYSNYGAIVPNRVSSN